MAHILIADADGGSRHLRRILTPEHDVTVVSETQEALRILNTTSIDLVIVDVHFDDSRMFDLIKQLRGARNMSTVPIICFCARETEITRMMHEALLRATRALGAWIYINHEEYGVTDLSDAEIKRIVNRCLTHEAREEMLARRVDIGSEREEIHRLREALLNDRLSGAFGGSKVKVLRERLLAVLDELFAALQASDKLATSVAHSREMKDRVTDAITMSEDDMSNREQKQTESENRQTARENALHKEEHRPSSVEQAS